MNIIDIIDSERKNLKNYLKQYKFNVDFKTLMLLNIHADSPEELDTRYLEPKKFTMTEYGTFARKFCALYGLLELSGTTMPTLTFAPKLIFTQGGRLSVRSFRNSFQHYNVIHCSMGIEKVEWLFQFLTGYLNNDTMMNQVKSEIVENNFILFNIYNKKLIFVVKMNIEDFITLGSLL